MLLVLCILVAIVVIWLLLVVSGCLALAWSRKAPERRSVLRLILALLPLLVGLFLFTFRLRWTMNEVVFNLSWPFAIPIAIGIVATVSWFRDRRAYPNA